MKVLSLRARLLIGLVALTTLGLGSMGVATYVRQRAFLYAGVNEQLAASPFAVAGELGVRVGGAQPSPPRATSPPPGHRRAATAQTQTTYAELLGEDDRVLKVDTFAYGEHTGSALRLPRSFPLSRLGSTTLHTFKVELGSRADTTLDAAAFAVANARTVVVAVSLRDVSMTLQRLVVIEASVGGGVLLGLLLLGWLVIWIGLRPLARIERVASEIAHGDLGRRVTPADTRTEIGRLGLSLNDMLVQIEQAFADRKQSEARLRQFVADASHELRTPLASVRAYAEAFRLGAASDRPALERTMSRIEAEAARMGVLVEDLLLLARLDQMPQSRRERVNLSELTRQAVEDARALAPRRTIGLEAGGPFPVLADPDQLRQVLANLLRNALIHTPADCPVDVTLRSDGDAVVLEVRDHGRGLPPDSGERVFERFWRTEQGRRRGAGGAGLGLAIVKAIVEAHNGEVSAANAPTGGAVFQVRIPAGAQRPRAGGSLSLGSVESA